MQPGIEFTVYDWPAPTQTTLIPLFLLVPMIYFRRGPRLSREFRKEEKMNTRGQSGAAETKKYLKGDRPQQRGYSEAVITEGGRTVWLAGQTATVDDNGRSLASDLEGQVRQLFKNLDRTLQKAGGKLEDMVQMTVFITDVRYGDRLTQIRREVFGNNFPGSALITITALAVPDAKVEIQGYAVIAVD
jgi:enamine deaminase RidA (YjgF/YER057c/UK114 family)